ncbi:hypothetical protein GCM10010987_76520 [Bradyrhizobium guangdongense]|uniref:Uncharacterized protein n=1 Tax=Bradyrhizobium guangdongense TaxID=1325090 RepID=A0AA88BCY9_9BRAD|nr:hypothetical protein GCM10010987_76520 [Bradyrhizobium guangdongense]
MGVAKFHAFVGTSRPSNSQARMTPDWGQTPALSSPECLLKEQQRLTSRAK